MLTNCSTLDQEGKICSKSEIKPTDCEETRNVGSNFDESTLLEYADRETSNTPVIPHRTASGLRNHTTTLPRAPVCNAAIPTPRRSGRARVPTNRHGNFVNHEEAERSGAFDFEALEISNTPATKHRTLSGLNNLESANKKEKKIQIFVKNLSGKTITLLVNIDDTVETIKQKIQDKEGCRLDQQRLLLHGGKELENTFTLRHYNIERETTLDMILRLVGGRPTDETNENVLRHHTTASSSRSGCNTAITATTTTTTTTTTTIVGRQTRDNRQREVPIFNVFECFET